MKRRLITLASAAAVSGCLVVITESPAVADTTCAVNRVCLWAGVNYTGTKYVFEPANLPDPWLPSGFSARSAKNRFVQGASVDIRNGSTVLVTLEPREDAAGFSTADDLVEHDTADPTCAAGYFCLWTGPNYTLTKHAYQLSQIPSTGFDFYEDGSRYPARSVKNRLHDNVSVRLGSGSLEAPLVVSGDYPHHQLQSGADFADIPGQYENYGRVGTHVQLVNPNVSIETSLVTMTPSEGGLILEYTITNTGSSYQLPGFYFKVDIHDGFGDPLQTAGTRISAHEVNGMLDQHCTESPDYMVMEGGSMASINWCNRFINRTLDPDQSMTIQVRHSWDAPAFPECGIFTAETVSQAKVATAMAGTSPGWQVASGVEYSDTSIDRGDC